MSYGLKAENILTRAIELKKTKNYEQALDILKDILTAKKYRSHWDDAIEDVMKLFLEICVEQCFAKQAKEALHQYRSTCQIAHADSLGRVIEYYLELGNEKLDLAQKKVEQILNKEKHDELENFNDELEVLQLVNGDQIKERVEKIYLSRWKKFMWESFRAILELLRTNSKLEDLYGSVAKRCMAFCVKFKRRTEFHRLGEMLRTHLSNLQKYQYNSPSQLDITVSKTQENLLKTRFNYLKAAVNKMESWNDAFLSAEDLHGLFLFVKRSILSPVKVARYYELLSKIFWASKSYLFHAYALLKHFHLCKTQNKGLSDEEIQIMASKVVVASLSVPVPSTKDSKFYDISLDSRKQQNIRKSSLLGYSVVLTRDMLLGELKSKFVLDLVSPELKELYNNVEIKFQPLRLCKAIKPSIEYLDRDDNLNRYVPILKKVIFLRLLQQIEKVYKTMKLKKLKDLSTNLIPVVEIEQLIAEAVKRDLVNARIDHQNSTINFTPQTLESDFVQDKLRKLTNKLNRAVEMIGTTRGEGEDKENLSKQINYQDILKQLQNQTQIVNSRKDVIETRKEKQEKIEQLKQQKSSLQRELQMEIKKLEEKNAEPKNQTFEKPVILTDTVSVQRSVDGGIVQKLPIEDQTEKGPTEEEIKKREEHEEKIRARITQLKNRLSYIERAKREKEIPLLKELYRQTIEEEKEAHIKLQQKYNEKQKKKHAEKLMIKNRLSRMEPDKKIFEKVILDERRAKYEKECQEVEAHNEAIEQQIKEVLYRLKQEKLKQLVLDAYQKKAQKEAEEEQRKQYELHRERQEKERKERELQRELQRERREQQERKSSKYVPPSKKNRGNNRYEDDRDNSYNNNRYNNNNRGNSSYSSNRGNEGYNSNRGNEGYNSNYGNSSYSSNRGNSSYHRNSRYSSNRGNSRYNNHNDGYKNNDDNSWRKNKSNNNSTDVYKPPRGRNSKYNNRDNYERKYSNDNNDNNNPSNNNKRNNNQKSDEGWTTVKKGRKN